MDRREFLKRAACLASVPAFGGCRSLFSGKPGDFDDDLMVFISDVHVRPGEQCEQWQKKRAMAHVAEILRMDPLPRNVLCFGDLAYSFGTVADYDVFREIVRPLVDAGVKLTLTMGNHDRRREFLEVFPEYGKTTKVQGRIVSVVEAPRASFVLLDTLDETPAEPGAKRNAVAGVVDDAQCEWFRDFCAKATKPVFAGAHHPAREMRNLSAALADAPTCYGWIHGHNHRWYEYFASDRYKTSRTVRTAGLPSTGHWGDIGYAAFRLGDRLATLTCRETEFFFPDPWAYTRVPDNWKEVARSHDGAWIVFPYDK